MRPANATLGAETEVSLVASRGAGTPVKAGTSLRLHIDTAGLPDQATYSVVVVNPGGAELWRGEARSADRHLVMTVPALRAGGYWVRVQTAEKQVLREFALTLQ